MFANIKTFVALAVAVFAPMLVLGADVALYSGLNCHDEDYIQTVPVWDNSCMDWAKPGWSSMKLISPGGDLMYLTAYSKNNCWPMGIHDACLDARWPGKCVNTVDKDGGANAIGAIMWPQCG
ncbi:hypothetical protein QBC39DRAFT_328416 [Podospora conica]|nr:hypothetical protein QBC39DRAFT_328416 [Schizothecium conicum]